MVKSVQSNFDKFTAAQSLLSTTFAPDTLTGVGIYSFNADPNIVPGTKPRIPLHIRTGQQSLGNPPERKRFKQVEVHGKGTATVRVYVDGVYVHQNTVTLTESPSKDRRLGIPTGTRGYTLDIEICGDANIRAVEYAYEDMVASS